MVGGKGNQHGVAKFCSFEDIKSNISIPVYHYYFIEDDILTFRSMNDNLKMKDNTFD